MSSSFSKRRDEFFRNHRRNKSVNVITVNSTASSDGKPGNSDSLPTMIPLSNSEDSNTSRSLGAKEKETTIPITRSSSFQNKLSQPSPRLRSSSPMRSASPVSRCVSQEIGDTASVKTDRNIRNITSTQYKSNARAPSPSLRRFNSRPPSFITSSPRNTPQKNDITKNKSLTPSKKDDEDDDKSVTSYLSTESNSTRGRSYLERSRKLSQAVKLRKQRELSTSNISQVDILHDQFTKMEAKADTLTVIDCLVLLRKFDSTLHTLANKVSNTKTGAELENRMLALQVNHKIALANYEDIAKANTSLYASLSVKKEEIDNLKLEVNDLQAQNRSLEDSNSILQANLNLKTEEIDVLNFELSSAQETVAQTKKDLDSHKDVSHSVEETIKELTANMEDQLNAKQEHIEKLSEELMATTSQQHDIQQKEIEQYRIELEETYSLVENLKVKNLELQKKYAKEKESYCVKEAELLSKLNKANIEIQDLSDDLEICQNDFDNEINEIQEQNEDSFVDYENNLLVYKQEISMLKENIQKLEKEKEDLTRNFEQNLSANEDEISTLKGALETMRAENDLASDDYDKCISAYEKEIEVLKDTLNNTQLENQDCADDYEANKSEHEEEIAILKDTIKRMEENYENTVPNQKDKISSLEQEIFMLKHTLSKNEEFSTKLLEDSLAANDEKEQQNEKKIAELRESHEKEIFNHKKALKEAQLKCSNKAVEFDEIFRKYTELEVENATLEHNVSILEVQLKQRQSSSIEEHNASIHLEELKRVAESQQQISNSTIEQLKDIIRKKELSIEELKDKVRKAEENYILLEEEMDKKLVALEQRSNSDLKKLQTQLEEVMETVIEKERTLKTVEQEREVLMEDIEHNKKKISSLEKELSDEKRNLMNLDSRISEKHELEANQKINEATLMRESAESEVQEQKQQLYNKDLEITKLKDEQLKQKKELELMHENQSSVQDELKTLVGSLKQSVLAKENEMNALKGQIIELEHFKATVKDNSVSLEVTRELEGKVNELTDQIINLETKNTLLFKEGELLRRLQNEKKLSGTSEGASTDEYVIMIEMLTTFIEKNFMTEHELIDIELQESMLKKTSFIQKQIRMISSLEDEVVKNRAEIETRDSSVVCRTSPISSKSNKISSANSDILDAKANLMEDKKNADLQLKDGLNGLEKFLQISDSNEIASKFCFESSKEKIRCFLVTQMQLILQLRGSVKKLNATIHDQQSLNHAKIEELLELKAHLCKLSFECKMNEQLEKISSLETEKQKHITQIQSAGRQNSAFLKKLEDSLANEKREVENLQEDLKEKKASFKDREKILMLQVEKLEQEVQENSAEVARLSKARDQLQDVIRAEYDTDLEELKAENLGLRKKVNIMSNELNLFRERSSKMLEESKKNEKEANNYIISLRNEKENIQDEYTTKLGESKETITSLENALSLQKKTVSSLRTEMKQLMKDMEYQLLANKQEQEGTQQSVNASKAKIDRLEQENGLLLQELDYLKNINEDHKTELNQLKEDLKSSKEEVKRMEAKAESLTYEMHHLAEISKEKDDINKRDINEAKQDISELAHENGKLKAKVQSLKKDIADSRHNVNSEMSRLHSKLQKSAKLLQDSKLYTEQLEGDLIKCQTKLEDKMASYEVLSRDAHKLRLDLEKSQKALMETERELLRDSKERQHRRKKVSEKKLIPRHEIQILQERSIIVENPPVIKSVRRHSLGSRMSRGKSPDVHARKLRRAELEKQIGQLRDNCEVTSALLDETESYVGQIQKDLTTVSSGSKTDKTGAVVRKPPVKDIKPRNVQRGEEKYYNYYPHIKDDDSTITCSIVSVDQLNSHAGSRFTSHMDVRDTESNNERDQFSYAIQAMNHQNISTLSPSPLQERNR